MAKPLSPNSLPPKELSIFKRIVKYYDQKQYKNGLKFTKQILSNPKFSEHGAMKGILLNCLGRKEEARDFVRRGLKANISSFVCWHIYGLVQKSDRKYEEAIKCYLQALKLDPDNLQVLRDLSVLQMQLRDYEGCKDTRYKLLMLRPSQRASWIGYAVVHHMLGNYEAALTTLSEFRKAQGESSLGYETSELVLYQATLMIESERYEAALSHLNEFAADIVDTNSLLELKAKILLDLGNLEDAKHCAWQLIDRNPENRSFFDLLFKANGINDWEESADPLFVKVLTEIIERYPRSHLAERLILRSYSDNEFTVRLDSYLKRYLSKGAPPLFIQLKSLWSCPDKLRALESLLCQYTENMDLYSSLHPDPNAVEPPSTYVWLNYLKAQFLSFTGRYQEALELIDSQLSCTPTLVDFYVLKADVYNAAGDAITASRWMEEAQSLDTADRFINARCTKYMVQAYRIDDALAMASKFTRGNTSAAEYLSEMQCMWFLTECARAHKESSRFGESLKLCHEVEQHYRNILDDQLDFHSYCLRKGTLRAYIETLRLEDRLRDHPSYFDVARLAIEIYLQLHHKPLSEDDNAASTDAGSVSSSEAKKLRNKQRKAARRAEAEAARIKLEQERREQALRSRNPAGEESDPDRPTNPDSGLDPHTLARPCNPLEEACKFLHPLLDLSPQRIEVHCMAYEIYERKNKLLLMLRSIKHGKRIHDSVDHPWFHECCVRFICRLQQLAPLMTTSSPESPVYKVLFPESMDLFPGWPDSSPSLPVTFNDEFMARNSESFPHVFRAVLVRCLIEPQRRKHHLSELPFPSDFSRNVTWETCADCLKLLKAAPYGPLGQIDASVIEQFRLACSRLFPMANAFRTETELSELRSKAINDAIATAQCGVYTSYTGSDVYRSDNQAFMEGGDLLTKSVVNLTVSGGNLVNGITADGSTYSSEHNSPHEKSNSLQKVGSPSVINCIEQTSKA
ncbi:unnamed protein product [Dicrocoelium dendriticum]|nr:unnamed protein product [Dicrocoelium dendriticum]